MDYFAGLDVSMEGTHVCVMDREGAVIHEVKVPSTPADITTSRQARGSTACQLPCEALSLHALPCSRLLRRLMPT